MGGNYSQQINDATTEFVNAITSLAVQHARHSLMTAFGSAPTDATKNRTIEKALAIAEEKVEHKVQKKVKRLVRKTLAKVAKKATEITESGDVDKRQKKLDTKKAYRLRKKVEKGVTLNSSEKQWLDEYDSRLG